MRKIKFVFMSIAVLFLLPFATFAGAADPVVSTDWLQQNLNSANVVIVDVRKVEEYRDGHIPNAINVFYNSWAVTRDGLTNELPSEDDLRDLIGSLGVGKDTTVVVVSKNDPVPERFNMTRVAWTLRYAGVEKVSVLSGGYDRWVAEKRDISKTANRGKKAPYDAPFNKAFYADKAYVMANLGKADDRRRPRGAFLQGREEARFRAENRPDQGCGQSAQQSPLHAGGELQVSGGAGSCGSTRRRNRQGKRDYRLLRYRKDVHRLVACPP